MTPPDPIPLTIAQRQLYASFTASTSEMRQCSPFSTFLTSSRLGISQCPCVSFFIAIPIDEQILILLSGPRKLCKFSFKCRIESAGLGPAG